MGVTISVYLRCEDCQPLRPIKVRYERLVRPLVPELAALAESACRMHREMHREWYGHVPEVFVMGTEVER